MGNRGVSPYLAYDPSVADRLVWDKELGDYKRSGDPFISRVPVTWIAQAAACSKAALLTGLVCWFLYGCNQHRPFKINHATAKKFGLSRYSKRKGLRELESAGLVKIDRRPGQLPSVEIVRGDLLVP